uniref:Serotonin N-acetyltransferase n=1 Tax=Platynereis dumerilii TaxID=6359 RepID=A0A097EU64_PLADU|nr:arylalkylamine N-acetyltransferase [Platynereis dumerilii]
MALTGEFRLLTPQDVQTAFQLELDGYPSDEAATLEIMQMRQREAPQLCTGYFECSGLFGFILATRAVSEKFTHESMSAHEPDGESVCIHSVCVDKARRRQGIALNLLKHFNDHVKNTQSGVKRIALLCHERLIPLYSKAGFQFVGKSSIVHGQESWFEMVMLV